MRAFFCIILMLLALGVRAEQVFSDPDYENQPNPLASPFAYVGGDIHIFAGGSPKSLNAYLDNNTFSVSILGSLYETLLTDDPITLEERPYLARQWAISDDKKTFTFWMDPRARWSDGKPVTVEDVKWTFDALRDPKNLTGVYKVALESFERAEIIGEDAIRFHAREVHWRNLGTLGGIWILPKHVFAEKDFNLINFEFPVVSGLYRLGEIKEGQFISLERRDDWWRKDFVSSAGVGNFQTIRFKIFENRENAYEAFLKGDIDIYPIYTSRIWVNETQGEKFTRNWIIKQKVVNYNPVGFQGFAMNMRRFPFDDVRVRQAMAHLVNRERMNETLMYSQYFMHRSYYEDLWDEKHPCPREPIPFDKDRARVLLAEAGWKANPETGILEKDGRPFSFQFLSRSPTSAKFLAIFQQDLKDVGVDMEINQKDLSAWAKDMDSFNYQMTWASWSAGVRKDPEGMWHSREAERDSGNNITGFKSERVDAIIEKQKKIFDIQARHDLVREVDSLIFDDYPYALLWNIDYTRLLYWNKFGTPPTVLSKYGDERAAYWYWWLDEDSLAELEDARENGRALPGLPYEIDFDKEYEEEASP